MDQSTKTGIFICTLGVLAALGVGAFYFFVYRPGMSSTSQTHPFPAAPSPAPSYSGGATGTSTTPGQNSQATMPVADVRGGQMQVQDFLRASSTAPFATNAGEYFIAGESSGARQSSYNVLYNATDQSFNIALLREPIASAREAAQQDLQKLLGLNTQQMCNLRYWVSVPYGVNQFYSGKNLGFSFCPGATPLQ